ncbi:hypothetical protein [Mycolicibacterium sp.]|nr:hypothetical protein [Mycolicibacterium sp.]MBJ7339337.1 hypothetical protein [Mycolicibacterium sp.]
MSAVVNSVRSHQAQRVQDFAADLLVGAAAYDESDCEAGGRLAESL